MAGVCGKCNVCGSALRARTVCRQQNRQIGKSGLTITIQVTAIIEAVRRKQHGQVGKADRAVAVEVSRAGLRRVVAQDVQGQRAGPLVLKTKVISCLLYTSPSPRD